MLMNKVEFISMNNPVRAFIQDKVEMQRVRQLVQLDRDKVVLEIGCGNGYGTKRIKKYFKLKKIVAIDLDPKMIKIAKKNNADPSILFTVGDAANLSSTPNNSFDAVFDFGIIHHIPNWQDCLNELKRVVKPEGQLILEDLSIETFTEGVGNIYRRVLDHPYKEMFTRTEFIEYLKKLGFRIVKQEVHNPLGLMKYFIVIAKK